jgi:UDP-N-acetylmuramoyl-tripeptide--D-alanyl-D-alanine ligase
VIWRASAVAAVVGGRLEGPDVEVRGATTDSRSVEPGNLFVPVVAARDGHDFVHHALGAGAAAYLTARPPVGGTAVVVDDTAGALAALGADARLRIPGPVVGVTGSVGKTSTKDLAAAALSQGFATAASPASYNNELGVPLTLVNAPEGCEVAVVEMGARGAGHIAGLCAVARPTIGVVTAVAPAHLEQFGSLDAVAAAKAELVEALPPNGTAVLNADDPRVAAMATRTAARVLTFGEAGEVSARDVRLDDHLRPSFRLVTPWGGADVVLGARGEHNVANALAAAAAALVAGVALEAVAEGLARAALSPWRMEVRRSAGGAVVINDAYNANPASTAAALRALARLGARRRFAVLGPMAELGDHAAAAHREITALARSLDVCVIAVGAPEYGADTVESVEAALAALGPLGPGDAVLVKGSRVAGLERLAEALLA